MKLQVYFAALAVAVCMLSAAGCSYDDTDIRNKVDNLDSRLTELEQIVKKMNTNIGSLMTIVEALKTQDRIESVMPLEDGTGYVITFTQSGPVTILHGVDGNDGEDGEDGNDGRTPVISIGKEADGNYYWMVNGEWLLDGENKIPATSDSIIPQIRVNSETGNFELSFDGTNWTDIGSAGGAGIFKDVIDGEDEVTFILSGDKEPIVIPKAQKFALNVDNTFFLVDGPGSKVKVNYTVTAADEGTVVEAIGTNGIVVESEHSDDVSSGRIIMTFPEGSFGGKVFIFAVNSKGTTSTRIITFEEGKMDVDITGSLEVPAAGGEIVLSVMTNYSYTVKCPNWITSQVGTKAVKSDEIRLTVADNKYAQERKGIVNLVDGAVLRHSITVTQKAVEVGTDEPGNKNPIEDWKDDGSVDW